jgi:glycosyltransferase involved in cell wall biosynthesis
LRERYRFAKEELVIGCFGLIGPTKRIPQVCRALATLKEKLRFRFLIVGEGDDLSAILHETGLADRTIRTGFADEGAFSLHLRLTDIVINLRHPSMGESSGTLTRAMVLGKPCIVSNDAAFAELPDHTVQKVPIGDKEIAELAQAINRLSLDKAARKGLGAAAKQYAAVHLDPPAVARQFVDIIETEIKDKAQGALLANAYEFYGTDFAGRALRESLHRRVPPHLQRLFDSTAHALSPHLRQSIGSLDGQS